MPNQAEPKEKNVFNRPLSASAIKTFMDCRAKFYRQYILGLPRYTSDALKFGRAVHFALESIEHLMLKEKRNTISKEDIEFSIQKFHQSCAEEGLCNFELITEGESILRKYFSTYDGNDNVIAVERRFRLTTIDGIPITGAIDKIVEVSDDTIVVVDYKTSFFTQTPSEMEDDIQLSMYDLAVRQLYPKYSNVILMLDYLRKKPVVTTRNDEQRKRFESFLVEVYKAIRELDEFNAKEQINQFCGWCDYTNICKSYNKVFNSENEFPELAITASFTEEDAIRSLELVKINQAILDSRKRELNHWVTGKMSDTGRRIENNSKYIDVIQQSRIKYDSKSVYTSVPVEEFLGMVTVNKTSLEKFLAENPRFRGDIERAAAVSYGSFYPQVKNKSS
jgi:RecB family exonuclease